MRYVTLTHANSNLSYGFNNFTISSPYIIPLSALYKTKGSTEKLSQTTLTMPILAYDAMGRMRTMIS